MAMSDGRLCLSLRPKDFLFQESEIHIAVYSNEWQWRQSPNGREGTTVFILASSQKDVWERRRSGWQLISFPRSLPVTSSGTVLSGPCDCRCSLSVSITKHRPHAVAWAASRCDPHSEASTWHSLSFWIKTRPSQAWSETIGRQSYESPSEPQYSILIASTVSTKPLRCSTCCLKQINYPQTSHRIDRIISMQRPMEWDQGSPGDELPLPSIIADCWNCSSLKKINKNSEFRKIVFGSDCLISHTVNFSKGFITNGATLLALQFFSLEY